MSKPQLTREEADWLIENLHKVYPSLANNNVNAETLINGSFQNGASCIANNFIDIINQCVETSVEDRIKTLERHLDLLYSLHNRYISKEMIKDAKRCDNLIDAIKIERNKLIANGNEDFLQKLEKEFL